MYIIRSETFIETDSLQHIKPFKNLSYSSYCFEVMLLFQINAHYTCIPSWLVHFTLNFSHLLNVKHWQYSHWNVLVMDICIVRINLEKLMAFQRYGLWKTISKHLTVTRKPKPTKNSTRPYLYQILTHFTHEIKTKDYDVIGVNLFHFKLTDNSVPTILLAFPKIIAWT